MNMIFQNVQVILAVDSTMHGHNGTEKIPRYSCSNLHWFTSVLHCGKKAVRVVSFPGLPPHINSPCSWDEGETGLVGENHLLPFSADKPLWSLHHFYLLRMFIVESRGFLMAALPRYLFLLGTRRTVLVDTGLFRCWFNSAVTLAAIVRNFLTIMRSNAGRSLFVNLEVRPELFRLLEVFLRFVNSVIVFDFAALYRKTKEFSCFGDSGCCHTSANNWPYSKLS